MSSSTMIGIDLGATHSCVGIWQDDHVDIIADDTNEKFISSQVHYLSPTTCLVGNAAQSRVDKNTVCHAKCLIGRSFWNGDEVKKVFNPDLPCSVVLDGNNPRFELDFNGQLTYVTPTQVSAEILKKLKQVAERYVNHEIDGAVIAVPASFVDSQRVATKEAGHEAGFATVELLNEPTAVAIAYGLEESVEDENILVFDLGASTLDVSVLLVKNRAFVARGTSGISCFGGLYFDREVTNYFATEYRTTYGRELDDDSKNLLRIACLKAKRELETTQQATVEIPGFKKTLSRELFNSINATLFAQVTQPIEEVLKLVSITKANLHHIVLVGGSSRIPKIVDLVSQYFDGRTPNTAVDPGEAVARGAAVKAGMILENDPTIVIMDIASRSLGIETVGGIMNVIINHDTVVPAKETKMFTTSYDNQAAVTISVYEGENPLTKDNQFLDKFVIAGFPPRPRGVPQIEVTLELDTSAILAVSAIDKAAGKQGRIELSVRVK